MKAARNMAVLALVASLALHVTALALTPQQEPIMMPASGGGEVAMLGSGFQDQITGNAVPVPAETNTTQPQPVATPQAPLPTTEPREAKPVSERVEANVSAPSPTLSQSPVTVATPIAPVRPETATEALPDDEPQTSVQVSPRPPARPDDRVPEEMRATAPPPRSTPQPAGNAEADAQRGAQTGQAEEGTAVSEGPETAPPGPDGNTAAANYPGLVMQRLASVRRDRVRSSGSASIAFSIAASGALASVSIARSAGNAAVDQAGLALVQRAAPFPAPPEGAQRSFVFEFASQ